METMLITCDCSVCNGLSAKVGKTANGKVTGGKTAIHNLVRMAHFHPFRNGAQMQAHGPWAV